MTKKRRHLGEILYEAGVVLEDALISAIRGDKAGSRALGQVLVEQRPSEETSSDALTERFGLEHVGLNQGTILPSGRTRKRLKVVLSDPLDLESVDSAQLHLGIHVEPISDRVRIRCRVDDACLEKGDSPGSMRALLVTHFKILSGNDVAERRLPQEGRIELYIGGSDTDSRGFSLPGGRTTTLCAVQRRSNGPDRWVIAASEPVEYRLLGYEPVPGKDRNRVDVRHVASATASPGAERQRRWLDSGIHEELDD